VKVLRHGRRPSGPGALSGRHCRPPVRRARW
jgi:hypothetical protein